MKKKYIVIFLILLLVVQQGFANKGKTGWSIFNKARTPKLKSISVTPVMAVRGDLSGVFYNPAVLSMNESKEIFFLSEMGLTKDVFGGIVYGHPVKNGSFAGGLVYYNTGRMKLNWFEGNEIKSQEVTGQQDVLGIVSYGRKLTQVLSAGVTVKFASSSLFERASAISIAVDSGCLYFPPIKNLSISGAIQNLGTSSEFVARTSPLPFSALLASAYLIEFNKYYVSPGFNITYLIAEKRIIPEIGLEFGVSTFSLGVGYKFGDESKYHFGITYITETYDIAYGFLPGLHLNSVHRLSIGFRF